MNAFDSARLFLLGEYLAFNPAQFQKLSKHSKMGNSLPGGIDRLNACPTNSTPGLVKVSEFSVGQAIPPASSLASEVFIPISKKLKGIPACRFQPLKISL